MDCVLALFYHFIPYGYIYYLAPDMYGEIPGNYSFTNLLCYNNVIDITYIMLFGFFLF